jgi:methionine-S-sulfoxide reductase
MANLVKATFGGGCFWCMEPPFEGLTGVYTVCPGYMGGHVENPTYEQVCQGQTGHVEVVQIEYDPSRCSYEQLLERFWENIDPTTVNQQFADRGPQYQTVIFYHDAAQRRLAEASKRRLMEETGPFAGKHVATEIREAGIFYQAESYHCNYARKNPERYQRYKEGSGRAAFLRQTWGRDS